jgi:hypothetical protein
MGEIYLGKKEDQMTQNLPLPDLPVLNPNQINHLQEDHRQSYFFVHGNIMRFRTRLFQLNTDRRQHFQEYYVNTIEEIERYRRQNDFVAMGERFSGLRLMFNEIF